jgi:chromosomal replication initiation ATPase DnaA
VLVFRRTLTAVNEADPGLNKFFDVLSGRLRDAKAHAAVTKLKDTKVPAVLAADNIIDLPPLAWHSPGGIAPDLCVAHQQHVADFSCAFLHHVGRRIISAVRETNVAADSEVDEVIAHMGLQENKRHVFVGRSSLLAAIAARVASTGGDQPQEMLVLFGDSGCGKTALLAEVRIALLCELAPHARFFRFFFKGME